MVVSQKRFVEAERETFTEYERHGATLSGTSDYVQTRPHPRNVRFDYNGPASDAELTPQKFRVTSYILVIDQCVVSLAHRLSSYEELCSRFGFLGKLESLSPVEIESSADNLVIVCKDDLEQCFGNELGQFVAFSNEFQKGADDNFGKEHILYKLIIDKRIKCSFPNVEIALRMYSILIKQGWDRSSYQEYYQCVETGFMDTGTRRGWQSTGWWSGFARKRMWDMWTRGTALWRMKNCTLEMACILVERGLPFLPRDCQGRLPVAWVKYDI